MLVGEEWSYRAVAQRLGVADTNILRMVNCFRDTNNDQRSGQGKHLVITQLHNFRTVLEFVL